MARAVTFTFAVPPFEVYKTLRAQTSWTMPSDDDIALALRNTRAGIYSAQGRIPAAMARVIGDGAISLHIVDVVVAKDQRGQGIGAQMMGALIRNLQVQYSPSASVTLMAAKGQAGFYTRLGFT